MHDARTMEQAILDAVVAQPDDPSHWLILADWLEDHDDPRAELVRLTWALQYEPNHAEFGTRQVRIQTLLSRGMIPLVPRRLALGFEFVWIAPGSFWIGSPVGEPFRDGDEARHRVTVTPGFWMATTPVTQVQWRSVMGSNPASFAHSGENAEAVRGIDDAELAHLPVESVSRDDALGFCERLSERLGLPVRLPTEAQWEFACRAGTTTAFPFGSILNGEQANCDGTTPFGTSKKGPSRERPTAVMSYPPNPRGLYDLIGNVGEWVLDAYRDDYEKLPELNPIYEVFDARRCVFRGGSWDRNPIYCRTAYRNHIGPTARTNNIGFRVILTV